MNRTGRNRLGVPAKAWLSGLIITLFGAGLLAACTTARPITLPSGGQGAMIGCSGVQHTMTDCYLKAGEICPRGYDIVGGEQGGGPNSAAASLIGVRGGIDRALIVHCH